MSALNKAHAFINPVVLFLSSRGVCSTCQSNICRIESRYVKAVYQIRYASEAAHQSFTRPIQSSKDSAASSSSGQSQQSSSSTEDGGRKGKPGFFTWANWSGKKNGWKAGALVMGIMTAVGGGVFIVTSGAPQLDAEGNEITDGFSNLPTWMAYPSRALDSAKSLFHMVRDPTSEKLLPDPLKEPYYQPPYTLVLELTDLLLSPQWDVKMGWRFKKRPGIDFFLLQMVQSGYEIVIFTKDSAMSAHSIITTMDSNGYIMYRLFKEDTRYTKGVHIKDLNCLNRDLSKVIHIDIDKDVFCLNPRNGLALKKWDGDSDDRALYDLAAFLQTIASNKVEDVRGVLEHYNQFDDPLEQFRLKQAEVQRHHEELQRLQEEQKKKPTFAYSDLAKRR